MKRLLLLLAAVLLLLTGCSNPEKTYADAQALMSEGKYAEAAKKFNALETYEDAFLWADYCEGSALCESGDYDGGMAELEELVPYLPVEAQIAYYTVREKESKISGDDWKQMQAVAAEYTALNGHADSAARADALNERATAILDSGYDAAAALLAAGDLPGAYRGFIALEGHRDSAEQISTILAADPDTPFRAAQVGEYVTFGRYWHTNKDNPMEPIEWRVIAREDDRLLLISRYIIASQQFNRKLDHLKWEKSSLRTWLNYTFMNEAFTAEQREKILLTDLPPAGNPETEATPSQPSQDKVFLLSIDEYQRYFKDAGLDGSAKATVYARLGGLKAEGVTGYYSWWLRSPGMFSSNAAYVQPSGYIKYNGKGLNYELGVRPAMWISLPESSSLIILSQNGQENPIIPIAKNGKGVYNDRR